MIEDLKINSLPYVDGVPDDTQQRISWIKNGDELDGASTRFGNDGNLNSATLCVQKNVEAISKNELAVQSKVNEIANQVNVISEALDVSNDAELISTISQNKSDIRELRADVDSSSILIEKNKEYIDEIIENIGNSTGTKTVRAEIDFVKKQIGNFENENIDGEESKGTPATGLKRRIISNTNEIVIQGNRLSSIETSLSSSNIPKIKTDLDGIRTELGPTPSGKDPVYTRLNTLEKDSTGNTKAISDIKTAIDFSNQDSLSSRVAKNESSILDINSALNDSSTGIVTRIYKIEAEIGNDEGSESLNSRVKTNSDKIETLEDIVGADESSGMRKEIIWIENEIGSTSSGGKPPSNSILGRLDTLGTTVSNTSSSIQDIQSEIGNNNEGIKGSVNNLNTKMNGTGAGGTSIESVGVFNFSKTMGTTVASKLDDAPSDGKFYIRRNKSWTALASSVAELSSLEDTISLTTDEAQVLLSGFSASPVNNNVTISDAVTVNSAGTYNIQLETEIPSISNVQLIVKVDGKEFFSLKRFIKFSDDAAFGSSGKLTKLNSGSSVSVYIKSLDDDSSIDTKLTDIKLTITPVL